MMPASSRGSLIGVVMVLGACGGGSPGAPAQAPPAQAPPVVWTAARPPDAGAAVPRDVDFQAEVFGLGQGWDAMTGDAINMCVLGTRQTIPAGEPILRRLERPFSTAEAAVLGPGHLARRRLDLARWSPLGAPEWDDPLSLRLTYGVEWRVGTDALVAASESLRIPAGDPRFANFCGDQYVGEIDLGGWLVLQLRLRFSTRAALADFERLFGRAPAIWDLARVGSESLPLRSGEMDVGISLVMVGGDVTTVSAGITPEAQLACYDSLARCQPLLEQFVAKAMASGPGSAADSVASRPAHLGARLSPYVGLGGPGPRQWPAAVAARLAELDGLATGQRQLLYRLGTLQTYWPAMAVAYPGDLGTAVDSVNANRSHLSWAADRCFFVSGPGDVAGIAGCLEPLAAPASPGGWGFDERLTLETFRLP